MCTPPRTYIVVREGAKVKAEAVAKKDTIVDPEVKERDDEVVEDEDYLVIVSEEHHWPDTDKYKERAI